MIRLTFSEGCTGDDHEEMSFTAPRSFFWEFARWCEEGRARAVKMTEEGAQVKVYGPTDGKREAERLVREGHGEAAPELDGPDNVLRGRHWKITGPRYVIDWYSVYYEYNRGGVSYRDPDDVEQPVYEILLAGRYEHVMRVTERPVGA